MIESIKGLWQIIDCPDRIFQSYGGQLTTEEWKITKESYDSFIRWMSMEIPENATKAFSHQNMVLITTIY